MEKKSCSCHFLQNSLLHAPFIVFFRAAVILHVTVPLCLMLIFFLYFCILAIPRKGSKLIVLAVFYKEIGWHVVCRHILQCWLYKLVVQSCGWLTLMLYVCPPFNPSNTAMTDVSVFWIMLRLWIWTAVGSSSL